MIKCDGTHVIIEMKDNNYEAIDTEFVEIARAMGEYRTPVGIKSLLEKNGIIPLSMERGE